MSTKRHAARNFANPINRLNSASLLPISSNSPWTLEFLLVGGGGGAGNGNGAAYGQGSAGGAGGVVVGSFNVPGGGASFPVTFTIGGGGTGSFVGGMGSNSYLTTPYTGPGVPINAVGGGGGSSGSPLSVTYTGGPGGSGGGGFSAFGVGIQPLQNLGPSYSFITQNLGNPGGGPGGSSAGYGGGGATSAGGQGPNPGTGGGGGGAGYTWPVNTVTYGRGGNTNPQIWTSPAIGIAGAPGTGNGAVPGNMGPGNSPTMVGGQGGGGACIIAIPTAKYPGSAPGSSSITTAGSKTVITYIGPGTYNT